MCPNGSITPNGRNASSVTNEMLQQRILELETALTHALAASGSNAGASGGTTGIGNGNGNGNGNGHGNGNGSMTMAAGGSSSGSSSTRAVDELNTEYGQLLMGDQPGSSRFFAQITPTYLHVSGFALSIAFKVK
jgi:hypothetical protein